MAICSAISAAIMLAALHNVVAMLPRLTDETGHETNDSRILKERGFSVATSGHAQKIWPVYNPTCNTGENAWHGVRFCFSTLASAHSLWELVLDGIALWSPAFRYSNVLIYPDPACDAANVPVWACVCQPHGGTYQTDPSSLTIANVNVEEFAGANNMRRESGTTLGFKDPADPGNEGLEWPYINYMKFGALPREDGTGLQEQWLPYARFIMAHELGHAIGLLHEHQRPDAEDHISFIASNHISYPAWARKAQLIKEQVPQFADKQDPEAMVMAAYDDYDIAEKIGFGLEEWALYTEEQARARGYQWSGEIDWQSIMLYSSLTGARPGGEVMHKADFDAGTVEIIYPGGSPDFSQISVSNGDIQRVAAMYPLPMAAGANNRPWFPAGAGPPPWDDGSEQTKVKRADDWTWKPLRVVMANLTTTVRPAPTDVQSTSLKGYPTEVMEIEVKLGSGAAAAMAS